MPTFVNLSSPQKVARDMRYIFKYIEYLVTSRHKGGFGIHSPFVFHLVTFVIEEKNPFYKFSLIEIVREKLLKSKEKIYVDDMGAGVSGERKLADIVKHSSKNKHYAQILFRIINFYKSQNILELGTSFGITTMYLAAPSSRSKVVTMEGSDKIADYAERYFRKAGFGNIELVRGDITRNLPQVLSKFDKLDFVFFDANHRKEPLLSYYNQCLAKAHEKTVFVIDDIYWSKGMEEAWAEIKQSEKVRVTIDMFFFGIVLFDSDLQKEDYTLRYHPSLIQMAKETSEKWINKCIEMLR